MPRGAIVLEAPLVRAWREGWIAGAGLDVFAVEPLSPDYPLLGMDHVVLTAYLALYTVEADERLAKESMARLLEILEGRRPKNIVNAGALGLV